MRLGHVPILALYALNANPAFAQDLPILGRTLPHEGAVISAPRSGQLVELYVEMADRVSSGDVLARFFCEIEQAQENAALAASRALELQYQSQQQLQEFASTSALEVDIALAEWQRSLAEAEIYASILRQCTVVAPFDGVISSTRVRNFEYVTVGEEILQILDDTEKFFEFVAPITWLADRNIGDHVGIHFEAIQYEITGSIDRISPEIDPVSQTVRVWAVIYDEENIIPVGMAGHVNQSSNGENR